MVYKNWVNSVETLEPNAPSNNSMFMKNLRALVSRVNIFSYLVFLEMWVDWMILLNVEESFLAYTFIQKGLALILRLLLVVCFSEREVYWFLVWFIGVITKNFTALRSNRIVGLILYLGYMPLFYWYWRSSSDLSLISLKLELLEQLISNN